MRIVSAILLALGLAAGSTLAAASPREELAQKVEQLKAKPSDNALREAIIKLAQSITPPPAVPEAAREQFVTGSAIAKAAKDASGQKLAIKKFGEALKTAPWWGDAYYNLAVAQELAGQFDAAIGSLKLYLLTNPNEKEAREAKDRIYALKGKAELAKAEQTKKPAVTAAVPLSPAATPADPMKKFDGGMWRGVSGYWRNSANGYEETSKPDEIGIHYLEVSGGQVEYYQQGPVGRVSICKLPLNGSLVVNSACGDSSITLRLSDDGQTVAMEQSIQTILYKISFQRIR